MWQKILAFVLDYLWAKILPWLTGLYKQKKETEKAKEENQAVVDQNKAAETKEERDDAASKIIGNF